MTSFTLRRMAAITILAVSASLGPSLAQQAAAPAEIRPYEIPRRTPAAVKSAVESPSRLAAHRARDADMRPAEILTLSEVRAGLRVLELDGYGNYYSGMLSDIIGDKGSLLMWDLPYAGDVFGDAGRAFAAARPNATYETGAFHELQLPRNIDLVFSVQAYHQMYLRDVDINVFHSALFKAMKPGAIYLVVDFAGELASGVDHTATTRRIDPTVVRQDLQAIGFQLVEDSRLLYRPQDNYRTPSDEVGDKADHLILKYRKPTVY